MTKAKEDDNEKIYEINRFKNQLDNSKNIDLNRSFDSSCKINNDLRKLNNIINNNNKKINKETNITKNTIQNNQSISQIDLINKKESLSNQSIKANNSINDNKNDKVVINVSIIDKKDSLDKTSHSESIIIDNKKESSVHENTPPKKAEKSSVMIEKKENQDKLLLKTEDLKNEEIVIDIKENKPQNDTQKLSKEKEEQLLLSKKKLQMSIDSSKMKLMEDFNLKLSSQDETLKMSVCRNSHGSLFDKVLNQVQLKNRTKKIHKNKENDDSFENRCIVQNTNKIFIVAEKPDVDNKLSKTNNFPFQKEENNLRVNDIKKSDNCLKNCPLIDKLMVEKQNGKNSVLNSSQNKENIKNVDNKNVEKRFKDVILKEENEVKKDMNNIGMDPKVYNDLLMYEKENMIIRNRIDINNLSNIEVNHSDIQKISPSLGFINGEERPILFETPRMFKLQICKTEFQIQANNNFTRERLQFLENTIKMNKYLNPFDAVDEEKQEYSKLKKGKSKEPELSSKLFKQSNNEDNDEKINYKSKSKLKNHLANELIQNVENKGKKQEKTKSKSELKSYQYKLSRENSKKCWKVKLYENKEKEKENFEIHRVCSNE